MPLSAVSVPGTVPLAFMEALGLSDRVASVSPYAVSACAQAVLACDGAAPDYEQLSNATYLAAELGSYTDALLTDDASPYPGSFAFSAALDRDVLARAEWFKFLGLFFNRERAASDAYAAVRATRAHAQRTELLGFDVWDHADEAVHASHIPSSHRRAVCVAAHSDGRPIDGPQRNVTR